MTITEWPMDDRPREKLLAKGPEALSDAELIAILLRTGIKGASAVDLARHVLARCGCPDNLREVAMRRRPLAEFAGRTALQQGA